MKMPISLKIAWKNLRGQGHEGLLSFNTWLSLLGVILGFAAVCVVTSVFNGFMGVLGHAVVDKMGHFLILNKHAAIENWDQFESEVGAILPSGVIKEPFGWFDTAMVMGPEGVHGAAIEGVDTKAWERVGKFALGANPVMPSSDSIWVGDDLAKTLGVKIGDTVQLLVPTLGKGRYQRYVPTTRSFKVENLVSVGMHEYDSRIVMMTLPAMRKWLQWESVAATGVRLRLSGATFEQVKFSLINNLQSPWTFRSWRELHQNFFDSMAYEKIALTIVVSLIIAVGLFNIMSTLYIQAIDRTEEISILRAAGARRRFIFKLFLWNGLFLGIVGATLGIGGAYALITFLKFIPIIDLPRDVYNISRLPAQINPLEWVIAWVITVLASGLASTLPAIRASRIPPIEGLRYE